MRPMLACSKIPKLSDIQYPVLASAKLDGIRCLIIDGEAVSRNLKPIPNKYVRAKLKELGLPALDGELMLKNGADFNSVQSAFMSEHGEPDFEYCVFDSFEAPLEGYEERSDRAHDVVAYTASEHVIFLRQCSINSSADLQRLYSLWLSEGYEGAIVRDPKGPYKFGRSTLNQGWMLKLKHFDDAEATILRCEELMRNHNEAEIGELGQTKRSKQLANLEGGDTLGSLVVEFEGHLFKIGTGFSAAQRQELWDMKGELAGQLAKFKYQELSKYGVPRFPVFLSLRDPNDV